MAVRRTSKHGMVLKALSDAPKTNSEISFLVDDIGPYVARMMAALRKRGYVRNSHPGKGRIALYVITDLGRATIAEAA